MDVFLCAHLFLILNISTGQKRQRGTALSFAASIWYGVLCSLTFIWYINVEWKERTIKHPMTGLTCWYVIAAFREMCALLVLDDCIFHMDFCSPKDLQQFSRMCSECVCGWRIFVIFPPLLFWLCGLWRIFKYYKAGLIGGQAV